VVISWNVRVSGPLVDCLAGLRSNLLSQGYKPQSCLKLLRLTGHLSRWLEENDLEAQDLTDEHAADFLRSRRDRGYTELLGRRALKPIRRYLVEAGVIPVPATEAAKLPPLEQLVIEYEGFLLRERGLSAPVVRVYTKQAQRFLLDGSSFGDLDLASLDGAQVKQFVLERARGSSFHQTRNVLTGLRSFLGFLRMRGHIARDLTGAVPKVAGWRLASLPKYLPPEQVHAIIESCDRRTTIGRRDYAALLLLARVGLRAGEVAGLSLDDVDWRESILTIRGKGGRTDRLPLSAEVGAALASYLRRRQPRTDCRSLFLKACAPRTKLGKVAVTEIVRRACKRAGLPLVGAHRLRHSAATLMLRKGATLDEVAQVLRHRHLATTAIYAKVDHRRLQELAQPWPGGAA